jgi:GTP-binding protein
MKIQDLKLVCTALDPKLFPRSPRPEIAVAGRSNVGKSSLLNTVIGRRSAARISKQPGKTQTVNFYLVDERFHLVDLPGYGYAKVSATLREKWKKVIYSYIADRGRLRGVVQLVDARHAPSRDDLVMIQHLIDAERPFIVVFTKADKISRSDRSRMLAAFSGCFDNDFSVGAYRPGGSMTRSATAGAASTDGARGADDATDTVPVLFFSSKTGEGKDLLWRWIQEQIA